MTEPKKTPEPGLWERWLKLDTGNKAQWAGAFVGFVGIVGLLVQINLTMSSNEITRRSAEASAKDATEARDAQRREQRAWISIGAVDGNIGEDVYSRVRLTNTGRTPAFNVRAGSLSHLSETADDKGDDPQVEKYQMAPLSPTGTVGSGVGFTVESSAMAPHLRANVNAVMASQKVLRILVRIEYEDVYKEPHYSYACIRFKPKEYSWRSCGGHFS
jgi:hypothetical protein